MAVKAIVLALAAAIVSSQNTTGLFELNIIHYNDFHAHFDQVSPQGTVCVQEEADCIGGFSRLYTSIMQSLEAEPASLVLNGGDIFYGTIWYNLLRWNVSLHFMNMLPHDAHVLGNHEFNHDIDGLVPYLRDLNSPMLGANLNSSLEPRMQGLYQNHVVVERHGRRIGIIGILIRHFSEPIGNIIMEDEVEAVNREAAILTEQGVDIIIVLSHCGYDSDQVIAARVVPEVDIIVGAHSHSLLYNGDETPNGETARGPYPTVVTRTDGHRIAIVQASCYTRYLGNIKFYIDDDGIVQDWEGSPIYLGTSIVQDPYMEELLEPWRQEVDAIGKEVLGTAKTTLSRECFRGECNLGSWVCDGFLEQLMQRAETSSAWGYGHVCLVLGGGLRTQINAGVVTTEALLMTLPFENIVQVYDLKGRYILEALEFSVGVTQIPGDFYSSRMLQVGGMRVVYNASAPTGSRVVSALVRCIDCDIPKYRPLDVDATYKVITQDYTGDGGYGYTMLSEHRENVESLDLDYVMLQRYLRAQHTIIQNLDGRIQIIY